MPSLWAAAEVAGGTPSLLPSAAADMMMELRTCGRCELMTIKVTPDQVDNAKLLVVLDKVQGKTSDEWVVRLANAKPSTTHGSRQPETPPESASSD